MNDVLLTAHLIGLMMGAGGGLGSMIVMRTAANAPADRAAVLRSLGPHLARLTTFGLIVMLATGLTMVARSYDLSTMPATFWIKMAFVVVLTILSIVIELTYAQVKQGKVAGAARLPVLGPIAGVSSLLAVIFAVLTFH